MAAMQHNRFFIKNVYKIHILTDFENSSCYHLKNALAPFFGRNFWLKNSRWPPELLFCVAAIYHDGQIALKFPYLSIFVHISLKITFRHFQNWQPQKEWGSRS
jgi:hypothetical protein